MTKRAIVSLSVFLLGGCPSAATDAAEKPAAAPAAKAADAVKDEAVVAKADEPAADDAGCIYAEGQDKTHEPACAGEPDAPKGGDGHFGAEFSLASAVSLSDAVTAAGDETKLIEGEVEAVCQKKGCWMVLKDGTVSARVLMKDHGFAVPMDSRGKKAVVEGTLSSRTFTEAQVKHLAKEGGKDPGEVSGTKTEHVLTASGIKIGAQS